MPQPSPAGPLGDGNCMVDDLQGPFSVGLVDGAVGTVANVPICQGTPADRLIRGEFGPLAHDGQRLREFAVHLQEIGRASCRERVCKSVEISVVAVSLNKNTNPNIDSIDIKINTSEKSRLT